MEDKKFTTDQVFGISRALPLNYVPRAYVDEKFINCLAREKHLVIYGSSKQGKTSLRKHCLSENDYIVVHCSNKWELEHLNEAILKQAGYEITLSSEKASSGSRKIFATIKTSLLGSGASGGAAHTKTDSIKDTTAPLELDPCDVNDIIKALNSIEFNKYIILEDFHYLTTEAQTDFSVALKAFHENSSLCFIIIGVWLEENRLTVFNGDLTGRVLSINADRWDEEDLKEVIRLGEELLHITFENNFKRYILNNCFDSVHIIQEACRQCCEEEGIFSTQLTDEPIEIGKGISPRDLIKKVVNEQGGRFNSFLNQFSEGFQSTELEMFRWLLFPIITAPIKILSNGIKQSSIRRELMAIHPRGSELNPGNVTQALQSCSSLQVKKDIKPIILDYDQTNLSLSVVDKSFLIWLENQDKDSLLQAIGLPTEQEAKKQRNLHF
ncbi:hypothetical protein KUV35_19100 [Marinobacter salsuginis]|uniref:hypothetical protein n=1 Tax=Marinobacter salsuginis TaxID=418719 RepID=UPI001C937AD3|nr:hypothetical protein [Marinobacter salsuginis]MBY6073416.1 hypothetical protein [Marinobacter salsuginis]